MKNPLRINAKIIITMSTSSAHGNHPGTAIPNNVMTPLPYRMPCRVFISVMQDNPNPHLLRILPCQADYVRNNSRFVAGAAQDTSAVHHGFWHEKNAPVRERAGSSPRRRGKKDACDLSIADTHLIQSCPIGELEVWLQFQEWAYDEIPLQSTRMR